MNESSNNLPINNIPTSNNNVNTNIRYSIQEAENNSEKQVNKWQIFLENQIGVTEKEK